MNNFSEFLTQVIDLSGVSVSTLGRITLLSEKTIRRTMHDARRRHPSTIIRLADAMQLDRIEALRMSGHHKLADIMQALRDAWGKMPNLFPLVLVGSGPAGGEIDGRLPHSL